MKEENSSAKQIMSNKRMIHIPKTENPTNGTKKILKEKRKKILKDLKEQVFPKGNQNLISNKKIKMWANRLTQEENRRKLDLEHPWTIEPALECFTSKLVIHKKSTLESLGIGFPIAVGDKYSWHRKYIKMYVYQKYQNLHAHNLWTTNKD